MSNPQKKTTVRINKQVMTTFETYLRNDLILFLRTIARKYGKKYGFSKQDLIDEFMSNDTMILPIVTKKK